MLFLDHLGWSHPEQMVTNCRMEAGVGHHEPSQTKGCQSLINIQTTAVTTGATSFTLRVVNCKCIKGLSLGWSRFIPTQLNPRYYMYFVTAMLQKTSSSRSSMSSSHFLTRGCQSCRKTVYYLICYIFQRLFEKKQRHVWFREDLWNTNYPERKTNFIQIGLKKHFLYQPYSLHKPEKKL